MARAAVHTKTPSIVSSRDGHQDSRVHTLRSMALRPDDSPKPAVEVLALLYVAHRPVDVELVEATKERKRVHCAIREPGVDLAVLVSCEHAGGLLERQDIWLTRTMSLTPPRNAHILTFCDTVDCQSVHGILNHQNLYRTKCGE